MLRTPIFVSAGTLYQLQLKVEELPTPVKIEVSLKDIMTHREKLKKHFVEEFKIKNQIMQYEKDIE